VSKARLVITAVVVEGRSQAETARAYGVSKGWVSKLLARYRAEGEAAFEPRSRRPNSSPNAVAPEVIELLVAVRKDLAERGLDAGPDTIRWHLQHTHHTTVSRATIARHLTAQSLVVPDPSKRPKSSYIRFAAEQPNECWQADFTHYRLTRPDGRPGGDVEILCWIDDHSRYALSVTAHPRVTGPIVRQAFRDTVATYGIPASTLTDNGMVFTTRLSGGSLHGSRGRNGLEHDLHRLGVRQKNSRPNHPTTCGKVERFQQTLKKWLRGQPTQPATTGQLQALIDAFADAYNHRRPHRSLPRHATPPPTRPAPKPLPASTTPAKRTSGYAATASTKPGKSPCVTTARSTPSASAEPTPEPTSSCSSRTSPSASSTPRPANFYAHSSSTPRSATSASASRPGPAPKQQTPEPATAGSGVSDVLRHHTCAPGGIRTHTVWCLRPSSLPVGIQGPVPAAGAHGPARRARNSLPTTLVRVTPRCPGVAVAVVFEG
jgi:transposase InsO family protein